MNYEDSKNETEILSAEDERLSEICRSLKKVDAPNNFDFKLKARIANSKAGDFQPRFAFKFRYALPALALILVLGLLAFNGGFFSSNNNQVVAGSETLPQNPALPQNNAVAVLPTPEQVSNTNAALLPANQNLPKAPQNEVARSESRTSKTGNIRKPKNDDLMPSEDKGVKNAPNILPKGFKPEVVSQNLQPNERTNPISVKDVLLINGINADVENGKWTVKSVTTNSIGENSGIKANDVIEAIDDQPISAETVFNKTVNGKVLTVTRDGKKSQIELRIKQ